MFFYKIIYYNKIIYYKCFSQKCSKFICKIMWNLVPYPLKLMGSLMVQNQFPARMTNFEIFIASLNTFLFKMRKLNDHEIRCNCEYSHQGRGSKPLWESSYGFMIMYVTPFSGQHKEPINSRVLVWGGLIGKSLAADRYTVCQLKVNQRNICHFLALLCYSCHCWAPLGPSSLL